MLNIVIIKNIKFLNLIKQCILLQGKFYKMLSYCKKVEKPEEKSVSSINMHYSTVEKKNLWFETCSPQYLLLIVLLSASLLASSTILVLFLTKYEPEDAIIKYIPIVKEHTTVQKDFEENRTLEPSLYENVNLPLPKNLTIVTRHEWLAQPPLEIIPLHLPVTYVIIMHTATENCSLKSSCSFSLRAIQTFHIDSRGWSDIGYNFLVGGDGFAYEGRGWKREGAHTYGYNSKSMGIAFIGNFNAIMPTERQILAANELIQLGIQEGYIASNYKLFAARQLHPTQSPGLMLYEDLQKWPHWTKQERTLSN